MMLLSRICDPGIKQVSMYYEVDPLICSKCQGPMKIRIIFYPICFMAVFPFSHILPSPVQAQYIVPVPDWMHILTI